VTYALTVNSTERIYMSIIGGGGGDMGGLYRGVEQKDRVFTLLVCFKRRGGRGKLWGGS
jgi:hypothetical protein